MVMRQDFQPVAIRIIDEINAHFLIFIANAAHFLVQLMRCSEIIDSKSQMELVISQIILFLAICQISQLQLMWCLTAIAKIDQGLTRPIDTTVLLQALCFFV